MQINKSAWTRVKLIDLVTKKEENDKENAKNRFDRFLKVEHLDAESLHVKRWGNIADEELPPTFYKIFRKGQVLFPTRNPHLRRTALATFDGICGEKTLTLEPNIDKVLPQFLPFLFHSDAFYQHTTSAIVGSTNPHVRWRDVADYEFLLPPKDQQAKLAELLWAMDDVVQTEYFLKQKLLSSKDSIRRALLSGNLIQNAEALEKIETKAGFIPKNWKVGQLGSLAYIKGRIGWRGLKQEEYTKDGPYLIAGKHINKGNIQWDKCDHITNERYEESLEIALMKGDIVFSKDGSIGNPALIRNLPGKATINSTMMLVRPHEFLYPEYFYQIMDSIYFKRLIRERLSGTAIPHIFQEDMKKFKFPLPSIEEQKFIAGILETLDHQVKSIELQINCSKSLQKSLINQIF